MFLFKLQVVHLLLVNIARILLVVFNDIYVYGYIMTYIVFDMKF